MKYRKFVEIKTANFYIYEKRSMVTRVAVAAVMLVVSVVYAIRFRSTAYLKIGDRC